MVNVLFVCTGNIFRSLLAEYLLKDYLMRNNIELIQVSSAGTEAFVQKMDPAVFNFLNSRGIDVSAHKQRKLTAELLAESDLVIAMAEYHQSFIKENFSRNVPLFDEVAKGVKSSVLDIGDVMNDYLTNRPAVTLHVTKIAEHIEEFIPDLCKNINSWMNSGH